MEFKEFKQAVAAQFKRMEAHPLFRVEVEKDVLWNTYLQSFPKGTNPIYRERTEHDCNCCKSFIRNVGGVIAIIDGKIESIWDINTKCSTYGPVAKALSTLVHSKAIDNIFLSTERTAGVDKNFEQLADGQKTWDHFFVNLPSKVVTTSIGPALGEAVTQHDMLERSLRELTDDAVDTVLELIAQNSLYRGEEHKFLVQSFKELKTKAKSLAEFELDLFIWEQVVNGKAVVNKIRSSVIGTLLIDLSEGVDLEHAVKSFEAKVAPSNYKRPSALVTKSMIDAAKKKVEELGLTSALERRYAVASDITVNNVLFANRSTKNKMAGNVFDDIAGTAPVKPKNLDKVEEVSIEKFIADILPKADNIELIMENHHAGNLMSLVAPVDPTAKQLFKWDNGFSWSYSGNMADSIKERVKAAGGNVTGDLCCRLAWDYADDLDFHMKEPGGGHIYFVNRRMLSRNGGMLDVDANGVDGIKEHPVENIFYANRNTMREGVYELIVNNYSRRSDGIGFEAEIDFMGEVHRFAYDKIIRSSASVTVAKFNYSKKDGIAIIESLPCTTMQKEMWGITTNTPSKVNMMMLSPNHWDGQGVGNKHYFFILDKCQNEDGARGFFNEFLVEDLNAHRKVIEIVGGKMKLPESTEQLSGLGFSSTQTNSILCRVTGSFTRTIKITF